MWALMSAAFLSCGLRKLRRFVEGCPLPIQNRSSNIFSLETMRKLTYLCPVDFSALKNRMSPFGFLGVSNLYMSYTTFIEIAANYVNPDQMHREK